MPRLSRSASVVSACCALVGTLAVGACGGRSEPERPAVATPRVTLNHEQAPLGSPLEITYRFVVAPGAHFTQDYRVMLHVLDPDRELMWTDDHDPPTPTREWTPGQTIEYTRTVFVPVYPYIGEAMMQIGLYSPADQSRLPLSGESAGQHAYTVAQLQLEPQSANLPLVFTDGWHAAEVAAGNAAVEWRWTKKDAIIVFKNPKKACVFYLDADDPGGVFNEPQRVRLSLDDGAVVDEFGLAPKDRVLRRLRLTPEQLGTADLVTLRIAVDKTFVPALLSASTNKDPRELGIRVFHAYVDPR